jgi:hypothetical protein
MQPTGKKSIIEFEIKYSLEPGLTKGSWPAFSDFKSAESYVVYPASIIL